MEARGETIAALFADGADPGGALVEGGRVGAFGHEQNVFALHEVFWGEAFVDLFEQGIDFIEVGFGGDDEFPLAFLDDVLVFHPPTVFGCRAGVGAMAGDLSQDVEVDAIFFVGLGEAPAFASRGGGVGEFGGDGEKVDGARRQAFEPEGARGFDGDVPGAIGA
jgi:hypothetical protein